MAKNLGFTMEGLGFEDSLNWSMQTTNPPDTNLAHYPRLTYYYHPDYLGHVEYITDLDGVPYQHFYYTAWGETLLDQKATRPGMNFDSPYRFNGKELDDETGLYYYGARYYTCPERHCRFGNPKVSVWLGVDPLASQFPHQSPYVFTDNNPIMLWDPTGMAAEEADPTPKPEKCPSAAGGNSGSRNNNIFKQFSSWVSKQITGKGKPSNPPVQYEVVNDNQQSIDISERQGRPINSTFDIPPQGPGVQISVNYNMFSVPDAIVVTDGNGAPLLDSGGPVSGTGSSNSTPASRTRQTSINVSVTPTSEQQSQRSWYNVNIVASTGQTVFRKTTRMAFFGLIPISKVERFIGADAQRLLNSKNIPEGSNLAREYNRRNPLKANRR